MVDIFRKDIKNMVKYLQDTYKLPYETASEDIDNMIGKPSTKRGKIVVDYDNDRDLVSSLNSHNSDYKSSYDKNSYEWDYEEEEEVSALRIKNINGTDYLYDSNTRKLYDLYEPDKCIGKLVRNGKIVRFD